VGREIGEDDEGPFPAPVKEGDMLLEILEDPLADLGATAASRVLLWLVSGGDV